jgi:subtilisin family serine protease
MRKALLFALLLAACTDQLATPPEASQSALSGDQVYVVMLAPAALQVASFVAQERLAARFVYQAFKGFAAEMPAAKAAALQNNRRDVRLVTPDGVVRAAELPWGLDRINQRAYPLDGSYTSSATGAGVWAYIPDTGILITHSEFQGRASIGFDAFGGNGIDCNGHGTHVAGIVAGANYGVAKQALPVGLRVLDCNGTGPTSGVIAGLDWIARNHRSPCVVNMSLVGGLDAALNDATAQLVGSGCHVTVAAGNSGDDACKYSPASSPYALTIGATGAWAPNDERAGYSNWGSCVKLWAPGTDILSACLGSNTASCVFSGTSMASPHATGVAALYLQANPGASPSQVTNTILATATQGVVTHSWTPTRDLLYSGLDSTQPPDVVPPNAKPVASYTYSCSGLTCSFVDTSTDDGFIELRHWDTSDHFGLTAPEFTHTFSASGTYPVKLVIYDNEHVADSVTKNVSVSGTTTPPPPPPSRITLTVRVENTKGIKDVRLAWSGATGATVDIYRDGNRLVTSANDGDYLDPLHKKGSVTNAYRVCDSTACSAEVRP